MSRHKSSVRSKPTLVVVLIVLVIFTVALSVWNISPGQSSLPLVAQSGLSPVSLGTYTQNWIVQYDGSSGPQYHDGPSQSKPLVAYFAGIGTLPFYESARFWTVNVQIPVTYSGGLIASCPFSYNEAIITGTANIFVQNVYTTINGQTQYHGSLNLGQVNTFGVQWNPCSPIPPVPGQDVKSLEFWITNTQNYNSMGPILQYFAFDLQAALSKLNVNVLSAGFTLSVTVTETVTSYHLTCTANRETGDCTMQQTDQNSGDLTYAVPWNPPAGLTAQATTTLTEATQTFGCVGATCTLVGKITQTITSMSTCYTYSGSTYCAVQSATTWTNTLHVTVTQYTTGVPPSPPNWGLILTVAAIFLILILVMTFAAFKMNQQPARRR